VCGLQLQAGSFSNCPCQGSCKHWHCKQTPSPRPMPFPLQPIHEVQLLYIIIWGKDAGLHMPLQAPRSQQCPPGSYIRRCSIIWGTPSMTGSRHHQQTHNTSACIHHHQKHQGADCQSCRCCSQQPVSVSDKAGNLVWQEDCHSQHSQCRPDPG